MKHVQVCLSANKNCESHCVGLVKLVQSCVCAGNTLKSRFKRGGGAVKHVQACLGARKAREISFLHCGGPVKLVQSYLYAGNTQ